MSVMACSRFLGRVRASGRFQSTARRYPENPLVAGGAARYVLHVIADGLPALARDVFAAGYGAPTRAQELAWPAIAAGKNALVVAPTGSGKTLAAFYAFLA